MALSAEQLEVAEFVAAAGVERDAVVHPGGSPNCSSCEHGFVTAQGSPMTRYRRAIETRSLFLAELAAREAGTLPLHDALGLVELYAATRDAKYEAAACRWLGRFALERQPTLLDLQVALAALAHAPTAPDRSLRRGSFVRAEVDDPVYVELGC